MTLTRIEDHSEACQRQIDALLERVNGMHLHPEPEPVMPTEQEIRERQFWFLMRECKYLNGVIQGYRRDVIAMVASVCFVFVFVGSIVWLIVDAPRLPITFVVGLVTGALTPLAAWLFYHREM